MEPPYSYGFPIFAGVVFSLWSMLVCYYFGCRQRITRDREEGAEESQNNSFARGDACRSTAIGESSRLGRLPVTIREETAEDEEIRQNASFRNYALINYMYWEYIL